VEAGSVGSHAAGVQRAWAEPTCSRSANSKAITCRRHKAIFLRPFIQGVSSRP